MIFTAQRPDPGLIVIRTQGVCLTVASEAPLQPEQVISLSGALAVSCSKYYEMEMRDVMPILMRSVREANDGL